MKIITDDNYQEIIEKANKNLFVIVFGASWCKPCKGIIKQAKELKIDFGYCDLQQNPKLLHRFTPNGIPLTNVYKDGKINSQHLGYINLDEILKSASLEHFKS